MKEAILILRLGPALLMLTFGFHQLMDPEEWHEYFPKFVEKFLPFQPVMRLHALGNVLIGIWLAAGWQSHAAIWVAFVWFLTIVPNAFSGNWKTGMRDAMIMLSLLALLLLSR